MNVLDEGDPGRIRNFFYHYRNGVYIRRTHYGKLRAVLFIGKSLVEAAQCLTMADQPFLRLHSIVSGLLAGCVFRPVHKPLDPNAPIRETHRILQQEDPSGFVSLGATSTTSDLLAVMPSPAARVGAT